MTTVYLLIQAIPAQGGPSQQEGSGLLVPLGIIISVVTTLAGAIVALFLLYRKTNADFIAEKERRHADALEYERTLSGFREKLASRKDGHGTA